MTDKKKTEVNLEMCSGFFRIPTEDIIYNITVLSSGEPSATKIVEKIIEVEKIVEVEKKAPEPPPSAPKAEGKVTAAPAQDDYFQKTARKFQQEIATAAREAGTTPTCAGGVDMAAVQDLAAMAGDLKEVLVAMKNQTLAGGSGSAGGGSAVTAPALEDLAAKISRARDLCSAPPAAAQPPAAGGAATKTITRYLFNLDAVFQTIYELCTNETVKGHIQNARAKANEIIDKEAFYDAISPKASGYTEDDGFLTVPMTDIYTALEAACSDKATVNLLSKMDKQKASIFLDQFLPLEVPPKEEVTVAEEGGAAPVENASPAAGGADALAALLSECQANLDTLIEQGTASGGGEQPSDHEDLINRIDDAITITASIQSDARRLAEDKGGGANPLWLRIKGLAALAETMLLRKEKDSSLTFEDGLEAGQGASQRCLDEITPSPPTPPPAKEPPAKKAPAQENFGEASQDDIDRLLEELG